MPSLPSLFHMRRKSDAPPSTRPSVESPDEIARKLGLMSIRSQSRPPTAQDDDFVGGFHPAVGGNAPYGSPGRPVPPPFPTPHPGPPPIPPRIPAMVVTPPAKEQGMSRTMEMALSPPDFGVPGPSRRGAGLQRPPLDASPRPRSDPVASPRTQAEGSRSVAVLPLLLDANDEPSLSAPPKSSKSQRPSLTVQPSISHPPGRSLSSPAATTSSSSDLPENVICSGFTKSKPGERCTRRTKRSPRLGNPLWYCFQHLPEVNKLEKFRAQDGTLVPYKTFIPEYLSPMARANLRHHMETRISKADGLGYIYVNQLEHKHKSHPGVLLFKAGRTVNPKRRHGEWSVKCSSYEWHYVYLHPRPEGATSLMAASLNPGPPGICCHRLEALVLCELADLSLYGQYLHPQFRDDTSAFKWEDLDQAVRDRKPPPEVQCEDCRTVHRELFPFLRATSGPLVGKELERVIIPIINRWANFLLIHAKRDELE
ncbi:uncharacterized protein B0H18DRAFT_1006657 [Fomitopsis serialis]|uniref:uncharacterized protein n=1 Tax=Fomitopsis serialis TaxID=139415 RepID=UPI00200797B4|nr:uncharacterized protein B0H18DRAFT_1006657 [Neoantrodia serialis]KAH9926133.1 hypothetical protein B0H18DRAFT_1006657 [Neoantrodia serialis]